MPLRTSLLSQITHGFFGRSDLFFLLAEFVREGNEESSISLALMGGEGKDACQVVPNVRVFFLAVVSNWMVSYFSLEKQCDAVLRKVIFVGR